MRKNSTWVQTTKALFFNHKELPFPQKKKKAPSKDGRKCPRCPLLIKSGHYARHLREEHGADIPLKAPRGKSAIPGVKWVRKMRGKKRLQPEPEKIVKEHEEAIDKHLTNREKARLDSIQLCIKLRRYGA